MNSNENKEVIVFESTDNYMEAINAKSNIHEIHIYLMVNKNQEL